MSTLKFFSCFVAIAVAVITAAKVDAATPKPHKLAPPIICTLANRMDVFVDEDNILWECVCEALKSGHMCHWQVVGGVDPVATRRIRKHKPLHPKRPIAYTIPAVVA